MGYFLLTILLLAGVSFTASHNLRTTHLKKQRAELRQACSSIEAALEKDDLPSEISRHATRILRLCRQLDEADGMEKNTAWLIADVTSFSVALEHTLRTADRDVLHVALQIAPGVEKALTDRLRSLGENPESAPDTAWLKPALALPGRHGLHHELALQLSKKKGRLPQDMRGHVTGIVNSAESILACMSEDPRDVAPGERFLSRYLPAAHKLVDEYVRLSSQGGDYRDVDKTLQRGREILARLEQAFAQEHANLLRNDAEDFAVELNVLDTLLKMDGK